MRGMKSVISVILAIILLPGVATCALAEAERNLPASYAVQAILPENQINDKAASFDLKVIPGQRQVLQVSILNRADDEIEVAIEANTAFSNSNGLIEFSYSEERDESIAVDFSKIVTPTEPVVTVPPKGKAIAEFILEMPAEPFEGDVYGGFMFTKLGQAAAGEEGTSVRSIYQYAIAVRLRESEEAVDPGFELLGARQERGPISALILNLRNPEAVVARGITLCGKVYTEGGKEAMIFERKGLAMAPNSAMPYNVYYDRSSALEAGDYRVEVELEFNGRKWQLEVPLTVE